VAGEVVAADLTGRKWRPSLALCSGVKGAQNIASRAGQDRANVGSGCQRILLLYAAPKQTAYFGCLSPSIRPDHFRSASDDVERPVVVECIAHHALANKLLNRSC
jgi:hypothetical protein